MIAYKTYRLLNDASVVDFLDISQKDVQEIVNSSTKIKLHDFSYYVTSDGKFLLAESIEVGGYLFHSLDDIIRMRQIRIKSSTIITSFWPEPRTFRNIMGHEIAKLRTTLRLDHELDYTETSIDYLEKVLQQQKFTYDQQVLSLYLGILSYVGESLIKRYNGKWHLEIKEENQFSSWEPKIKLQTGKILDPFVDFFDGLILRSEDNELIPIISLRLNAS